MMTTGVMALQKRDLKPPPDAPSRAELVFVLPRNRWAGG